MKNALTEYDNDVLCTLYKSQDQIVKLSMKCVRACREAGDVEGAARHEQQLEQRRADLLRIGVALLHNNRHWGWDSLVDVVHHHAIKI